MLKVLGLVVHLMIDIFDNPLILEDGRSVQWDVFEGQFLSLYRDILCRKGDARQNASAIVRLCRAAIGGYARKEDFVSVCRVIQYYTSRADVIQSAGDFTDIADFSIVHYSSVDEQHRLQMKVLPGIAPRADEALAARDVQPSPVQVVPLGVPGRPAISSLHGQQETASSSEQPVESQPGTVPRAEGQKDLASKAGLAPVQIAPTMVDSSCISPLPAQQETTSAEPQARTHVKPDTGAVGFPQPDRRHVLRKLPRDAASRRGRQAMTPVSRPRAGHLAAIGLVVRGLFGNLGREPSDLASKLNRSRARRRMNRMVEG